MTVEAWILLPSLPKVAVREAQRAEAEGWDGVMLADSQNLAAELIVELTLIAVSTQRILFAPGVTNSVTRHPAVLAGAMATLQVESGGRAVVGIGRGDSALAHIGCAPAPVASFKSYLAALQGYLRGKEVPFDLGFVSREIRSVDTMNLAGPPASSALRWLRPHHKKVPVGVAATGPRVIDLAASLADGVDFSVGAHPDRIGWAVDRAREARRGAGLDEADLRLGAYVNIGAHPDLPTARQLVGGGLAGFSRFSVMHGQPTGGAQSGDVDTLRTLHKSYDMTDHGNAGAGHTAALTDEFAARNAIIGAPEHCVERIRQLYELGVRRFLFMAPFTRDGEAAVAHRNLVEHVLPEIKSWS